MSSLHSFIPWHCPRVKGHLQTDIGMLNVIMTLRGEGGSAHNVNFLNQAHFQKVCVCLYVCMYVRMYVYIFVCIFDCLSAPT